MKIRKWKISEQGQALVELAMVLPILLLLLFGIIEYGRIMSAGLVVTHSARDAARFGSVGATDSEIIDRIRTKTAAALYDTSNPAKLSINIVRTMDSGGDDIRVDVSYPVTLYMPIISSIAGNPFTVKGSSVMRLE